MDDKQKEQLLQHLKIKGIEVKEPVKEQEVKKPLEKAEEKETSKVSKKK